MYDAAQGGTVPAIGGMHLDLGVLGNEVRDFNRTGYGNVLSRLRRLRTKSGERNIMSGVLGKDPYRSVVTKQDILKLQGAKPRVSQYGIYDYHYTPQVKLPEGV